MGIPCVSTGISVLLINFKNSLCAPEALIPPPTNIAGLFEFWISLCTLSIIFLSIFLFLVPITFLTSFVYFFHKENLEYLWVCQSNGTWSTS